jgi:hypothetical protein
MRVGDGREQGRGAIHHAKGNVRVGPGVVQPSQGGRGEDQVADALELKREDLHVALCATRYASSSR